MNTIAQNKEHLNNLIKTEIDLHGYHCNLNHIDTSLITDMSFLFSNSQFNGDISQWDTSNVKNMNYMFQRSIFDGDISTWNVSNVENMRNMFFKSCFNRELSSWNVPKVHDMYKMFSHSQFNGNTSEWNVSNIKDINYMFEKCKAPIPHWFMINNLQELTNFIEIYEQKTQLENLLHKLDEPSSTIKI